jgi:hypothetical protein
MGPVPGRYWSGPSTTVRQWPPPTGHSGSKTCGRSGGVSSSLETQIEPLEEGLPPSRHLAAISAAVTREADHAVPVGGPPSAHGPAVASGADLSRRPVPSAPPAFHGSRSAYIELYLEPRLPGVRAAEIFHRALVGYLGQSDTLHLVRAGGSACPVTRLTCADVHRVPCAKRNQPQPTGRSGNSTEPPRWGMASVEPWVGTPQRGAQAGSGPVPR